MRFAPGVLLVAAVTLLVIAGQPAAQTGPGDKKAAPGAGGGFQPGGLQIDADKLFDTLGKGGDSIAIADAGVLKTALEQYAAANNIKNGLITRQQFQAFVTQTMQKAGAAGFGGGPAGGPAPVFGGGGAKGGGTAGPVIVQPLDKDVGNADEEILADAGLSADGDALLEFFRERMQTKVDFGEMLSLAKQLGKDDPELRAKAAAKLVARGPWAVPALHHVMNDLGDPLAAQQARQCLEWIEGKHSTELPIAAAKLLAARNPKAAATLLAYLPFADDETVVDGVKAALDVIAARPGKADAALVAALKDKQLPLRRVIAAEVLAGSGKPEVLPDIRNLLNDPKTPVRLRTALALVKRLDEPAVKVLIDLLLVLPPAERRQAEKALQQLAGDWAPTPPLAIDDDLARKVRHEAWAGWWRTVEGPALMAALRRRTLSEEEIVTAQKLIADLGDASFTKRERATVALTAQGSKVVGLLRDAAKTTDLEQSGRIETCLKKIALNEARDKLPASAPRLLVVRKPPGATEALLGFVPFTDDRSMKEEIVKSLTALVLAEGKSEVVVVKALGDQLPVRRITAAEVLLASGGSKHWPAVRNLLADADPEVRQRAAMALVLSQDKQAVPALIKLLAELPRGQAWEVEELLHRIAGAGAPTVAWDKDDAAARKKLHAAWQTWWKNNAAFVNLAELDKTSGLVGYTLIAEVVPRGAVANPLPAAKKGAPGGGKKGAAAPVPGIAGATDRLVALDRNGEPRWQIDGMDHPIDFQILPGGRVLVAEYKGKRVTERDSAGNVTWQVNNLPGAPTNVQRLSNGNTFIALYNSATVGGLVMEVDRAGKTVSSTNVGRGGGGPVAALAPNEGLLIAAHKTPEGHLICLFTTDSCIRFDAAGKEIKRFVVAGINFAGVMSREGNIDITSKGHLLVIQNMQAVAEYDPDGKIIWQARATGNRPTRLANGNTLVASETNGVVELDNTGKTVWTYQPPPGHKAMRARQVGDSAVAAPRPIVAKSPFPTLPVPDVAAVSRRTSPADALKRQDISAAVLAGLGTGKGDAPKELVAVLGKVGDPHVVSLAITRDGRTLVTGAINEVKAQLFDLASGKLVKTLTVAEQKGSMVAITADGTSVALTGDRPTLQVVEAATGKLRTTVNSTGLNKIVLDAIFSPDGKLVVLGDNAGNVLIHDLQTGASRIFAGHVGQVTKIMFSPDGKFLVSAGGNTVANREVIVWELASGKMLGRLKGHTNAVLGLAWHPSGKVLATSSLDGTIRLWDLDTMTETAVLRGNGSEVHGVAWHPSGGFLASHEHTAGTVTLWDMRGAQAKQRVIQLYRADAAAKTASRFNNDVLFTPEGRHLIAGNADGTVSVLRLAQIGELLK